MKIHASLFLALSFAAGCTGTVSSVGVDPAEQAADTGGDDDSGLVLPDVECAGNPDAGPALGWQHPFETGTTIALGADVANHRGIDLVAGAGTNPQVLQGELRYGLKSLEHENVTIFACRDGAWQNVGAATSDDSGDFSLSLADDARLPIGIRTLYVSVDGDRSGADFVGIVAPDGRGVTFSDVDGTLTSSENAAAAGLIGLDVEANPGAADALNIIAQKGYPIVYVTAMARTFTNNRRAWLEAKGFPRGALRLAEGVLLPGQATIDYKTQTFQAVAADSLVPSVGLGNRASDATAYQNVGIAGTQIFLKLGEFDDEDQPVIDAGQAVGVPDYSQSLALFQALPNAQ
jgi:LNS2 (Lipin/Ned1/Smp2)